jgi:hypothetical protein
VTLLWMTSPDLLGGIGLDDGRPLVPTPLSELLSAALAPAFAVAGLIAVASVNGSGAAADPGPRRAAAAGAVAGLGRGDLSARQHAGIADTPAAAGAVAGLAARAGRDDRGDPALPPVRHPVGNQSQPGLCRADRRAAEPLRLGHPGDQPADRAWLPATGPRDRRRGGGLLTPASVPAGCGGPRLLRRTHPAVCRAGPTRPATNRTSK